MGSKKVFWVDVEYRFRMPIAAESEEEARREAYCYGPDEIGNGIEPDILSVWEAKPGEPDGSCRPWGGDGDKTIDEISQDSAEQDEGQ